MSHHIEGHSLVSFDVAADGTRFRLNVADARGKAVSLSLPAECLNQLIVTLPRMSVRALRNRYCDDSLRVVYPAASIRIELASDAKTFIVTLETADGFSVSFGLSQDQLSVFALLERDWGARVRATAN
jgi:hypothetical protein